MMNKQVNFWKAYLLTLAQVVIFIVLSFLAYLLIVMSMAVVYPFLQIISQIQSTGDVMPFADQFLANEALFTNFLASLIVIALSYTIIVSGILSLFDYLIMNRLKETSFKVKEWLFDWFNYASMALLLLMLVSVFFFAIGNVLWLALFVFVSLLLFCYLIVLMQFKKNLIYAIRKTWARALLLLLYYIILFLIVLLLIGLLKWAGFIIGILLFLFMLLWSKIYLMKKL